MEIRVLGCYGGELPGYRTTCFLVDSRLAVDAGALTSALSIKDQSKVDAVLLTHSHLDHVRDLGFLTDNVFGKRESPVCVYALPHTIRSLKEHIFNNELWPDFSRLPDPENPVIEFNEIPAEEPVEVAGYEVQAVEVSHTVPACGLIVKNRDRAFAVSGDTAPTQRIWEVVSKEEALKELLLETSFPDRLVHRAEDTGHLTPGTAQAELEKLGRPDVNVRLYHMKPQYLGEINKEVLSADHQMLLLQQGEHIEI